MKQGRDGNGMIWKARSEKSVLQKQQAEEQRQQAEEQRQHDGKKVALEREEVEQ